ncbi:MAG TPA: sodium/proton-translocating pyrophosphatase, partial [Polyangiales bacterium]
MEQLPIYALGTGVLALVVALGLYIRVKSLPEGNAAMQRIARYIREGAMAFLVREYKVLGLYAVVVSGALFALFKDNGAISAGSFFAG